MKLTTKLKIDVINFTRWNYNNKTLRKKSGGTRAITALKTSAPDKEFINGVLKQLNALPTHPRAIAYKKGMNYVPEIAKHAKFKFHYKFDFTDFFGSFTIQKLFELGVHKDFSRNEFIALLTGTRKEPSRYSQPWETEMYNIRLGQGAPTSPVLTNILMFKFDALINEKLVELVPEKSDIIYSRYADDILISTNYKFNIRTVQTLIKNALTQTGVGFLKLNNDKTRRLITGGKSKFLGLTITAEHKTSTGAEHRRKIIKNLKRLENTKSVRIHKYEPWLRAKGLLGLAHQARYVNSIVENKINWELHVDTILSKTIGYDPANRNHLLLSLDMIFKRYKNGPWQHHTHNLGVSKKLYIREDGKSWEIM